MYSMQLHAAIEHAASSAWPAAVNEPYGDWRLRYDPAVPSKRCNSALCVGPQPDAADWLDHVRHFYESRGATPRFHVSDASPDGLDAILDAAGFRLELPCAMFTMDLSQRQSAQAQEISLGSAAATAIEWADTPDDEWFAAWLDMEGFAAATAPGFRQLMRERIAVPARYGAVRLDGRIAAVASAVVHGPLSGLYNVIVHPDFRRMGLAEALVSGLADWSRSQGAQMMYLQALRDNEPAVRLYGKLGFAEQHRYHYRSLAGCS